MDWHVSIDTAPAGARLPEETLLDLSEALRDHAASVGEDVDGGLSFALAVDAPGYGLATRRAWRAIRDACSALDVELGTPVDVRVVEWERFERELDRPTMPDLVSSVEAAELLGVSRQRVHQLASEHPDFPEPLATLRTGPLWVRAGIESFAERWDRRPGRRARPA